MICIVIGSEQGFCGDFNDTLLAEMNTISLQQTKPVSWLIVGRRLDEDKLRLRFAYNTQRQEEIETILLSSDMATIIK